MIAPDERLVSVLARDESLLEVLAGLSDQLRMLRSPAVREVMARLVTVEEAAGMAGMTPADLVSRLEAALHSESPIQSAGPDAQTEAHQSRSEQLDRIAPELIDDLDVRDDLGRGEEPFHKIMGAVAGLREGHVFRLRATFDPSPLKSVMAQRGFAAYTERLGEEDWRVWFYPTERSESVKPTAPRVETPPDANAEPVVLDVRGLEPPEPMTRTLAALTRLPPGGKLVQLNVRVPELLLPLLTQRGFAYEIRQVEPELVEVVIEDSTRKETQSG